MKSPDEIKKGLVICYYDGSINKCVRCPYSDGTCGNDLNAIEKDALALIQQLEAQVPRWISVEERLPESFRIVLCSDGERVFQAIYETGSKYFPDHWGEVICLDKNGGSTKHMHEPPTHWMPLPEPPKEE